MTAGGAASGKSSGMNCSRDLPQGQRGLPAAVVVTTDCWKYRLGTDGSVAYTGKWKGPVPKVARGSGMDLTWYAVGAGYVLIGQMMKRLWRSNDTYPRDRYADIGSVI